MADSRDRLLSGRYRLMHELGRGGMGTVWWALDEVAGREVAVKEVYLPHSLSERERLNLIKRTNREAMAAGRLRHPGLIAMYDVVVEDDRPWLVMEYVAARSLDDVLTEDGPISPPRVADIGRQLLDALCAAHAAGIVHRDVKPSNVLLEGSGRVVLTDFGIATYEGATTLTQSGSFMGSPAYVAPEVARGERASPASDLWSLGATLYAATEGRPPYDHDTAMATLSALVTSEPDPPVNAGPLRPLLDGLLQKDPARRPPPARVAELLAAAVPPPPGPQASPGRRADGANTRERRPGMPRRAPSRERPALAAAPPRPAGAPDPPGAVVPVGTAGALRSGDVAGSPAPAPPAPSGRRRAGRGLMERPGVAPAVTGGVLALAVAAGVVAGLRGWAGPRPGAPGDHPSLTTRTPPAAQSAENAPPGTLSPPPASSSAGAEEALPATLRDASGRPVSRRIARRSGVWPGTPVLTVTVPVHGRRVGLLMVCRSGAHRLSFTAAPLDGSGRTVRGDCAGSGHHGALTRTFRLQGGASQARIRVRIRPGTRARSGPVEWLAGVYEALTA